ncbi:MAG TPA: zf-TFIIB domain-containing protein [Bacteroidota bacterium]|nr:zf-TFIIB domain-containing protein [Bacteroidota bacterium]
MPHHFTPHRNEDEYFARREAELLRQQREALRDERLAAERRSHYKKCPACGYDLMHSEWEDFHLDQCPHCHGIWITAEQARRLMHHPHDNPLTWILQSVMRGVAGVRTGTS